VLFRVMRDRPGRAPLDVFRLLYLIAAVPAAAAVLYVMTSVRDLRGAAKPVRIGFRAAYGPRFRWFMGALLVFALGNSSDMFLIIRAGSVLGYAVVFNKVEGAAPAANWAFPVQLPVMVLVLSVAKMVFTLPGGILADRIGRVRTLALGWGVYAAVYCAFGFVTQAWQVWGLFVAYGAFYGLTEGVEKAVVADLVRPEVRGAAYGLYAFADGIARFPASLILGILYQAFGPAAAFTFGGACAALGAVLLLPVLRPRRPTAA
jgi:MFS family permease